MLPLLNADADADHHSPCTVIYSPVCWFGWCAQKLSNLRVLSHHIRSELLPELEDDLINLQKKLKHTGIYNGPISTPSHTRSVSDVDGHSRTPSLIPPTPIHPSHDLAASTLAVPPTPLTGPGSVLRPGSIQSYGRFTGAGAGAGSVAHTPLHVAPRLPSRVSDSVRRAAYFKATRQAHQRGECTLVSLGSGRRCLFVCSTTATEAGKTMCRSSLCARARVSSFIPSCSLSPPCGFALIVCPVAELLGTGSSSGSTLSTIEDEGDLHAHDRSHHQLI